MNRSTTPTTGPGRVRAWKAWQNPSYGPWPHSIRRTCAGKLYIAVSAILCHPKIPYTEDLSFSFAETDIWNGIHPRVLGYGSEWKGWLTKVGILVRLVLQRD
jgi:hypothetical protein